VHIPAGCAKGGVVLADGVFVRPFEQAVHFPVGVVVQLDLAYAEPAVVALRASSAICAMASAGSFRSS
jgi:hypothetical protein